jgi:hypothetical protein
VATLKITGTSVIETLTHPVRLEVESTGCDWTIRQLEGPRPGSGSLLDIPFSGVLKLHKTKEIPETCPETASLEGTMSLEEGEQSPEGPYTVQEVG